MIRIVQDKNGEHVVTCSNCPWFDRTETHADADRAAEIHLRIHEYTYEELGSKG